MKVYLILYSINEGHFILTFSLLFKEMYKCVISDDEYIGLEGACVMKSFYFT